MSIERPEPTWLDMALVPEATKDSRTIGLPQALEGWVRLGVPVIREVVAGELEGDAAAQLRADAGRFRYHLLQLACTLRPPAGERFRRAFLSVNLGDDVADGVTIAYAMDPTGETVASGRSTTLGFTANLGLVSISAEHSMASEVASVIAYDVRTSHPSWELGRVGGRDLIGAYYFAVLTRSPVATRTCGRVGLSATVEKWRFLRLEAAYPEGREASFEIEASS
jgi:hypothetical protein